MFKFIKKSFKYLIILAGIAIMIPTLFYVLIQLPEIQTLLVKRVTNHFSSEIKSTIKVGRIEYKFFNKLTATDVLIKDSNNDTLLYVKSFSAYIRSLGLKNSKIRLGKVELIKPVFALITDSSGVMNLNRYLDLIKKPPSGNTKNSKGISVSELIIKDARFSLINKAGRISDSSRIDFKNLHLSEISGNIEDINIHDDTTSFEIYKLGFKEASGFRVKKINCTAKISGQNIFLNSTQINCDSSIIDIPRFSMTGDSASSFSRFNKEVKLDLLMDKSLFNTSDLKYFVPTASRVNESVWLSGSIHGSVSELRGRNIQLKFRDYTELGCDFDFSGLPAVDKAYMFIEVNNLVTNAKDFGNISIKDKGKIEIPGELYKLGNISFQGSFTGFLTDFVTYGKLQTSLGTIRTDISLRPEEKDKYKIKGLLTGTDIDLGQITDKPELLGKLSISANVDGYAYSLKKFAAGLTGKVDSVEINKYKYRNIGLNGFFTEKTWDGSIKISDENIKMDLLGSFDFKKELPEFDFTLNLAEANLNRLNFDKSDSTSQLTMLLTANFKGSNIDNLDGEIRLLNSTLRKNGNKLELYDFSLKTYTDLKQKVLTLRTDFVDADIRGRYNFAELGSQISRSFSDLMPSWHAVAPKKSIPKSNNFSFDINFRNTDKINSFFGTGLLLADKSYIRGTVVSDSILSIFSGSRMLSYKNNVFNDFGFATKISGSTLTAGLNCSSLLLLNQTELKGFNIKVSTLPDNFVFSVDWDNKEKILNKGNFTARGKIEKSAIDILKGRKKGKEKEFNKSTTILSVTIDSSDIYLSNNRWRIKKASVVIDSSTIKISKLSAGNENHYYVVDGAISVNPADTLYLLFNGIDIAPLNYIGNQKNLNDPNRFNPDLKGIANGKILLTDVYRNLLLEGNLNVTGFSILSDDLGNLSIKSAYDIGKKVVNLNLSNDLNGLKMLDVTGYYDPLSKKAKLSANTNKLPVNFLNPLLKTFASGITGTISGKVALVSEPNNIYLKGAVMAENGTMKVDYLQTKYKLNDSVRLDKKGISFNNFKATDEKGNSALLSGSVNHKNFKDWTADIIINMNGAPVQVLNTKPRDNELFYGTAYGSGVTTIKSNATTLSFDISAKTGKNTRFYIPLTKGLSVSDYSFISFIDSTGKSKEKGLSDSEKSAPAASKKTGIELNIDLDVNPDAEVQLIFDSKVGDVMKGRGSGNLNVNLSKKGEFRIVGDYIIEEGDYLFTLGNILNKSFSVENGGKILFNGDIDNAEIDIKAIYRLKASLSDLLGDERFSERIPIECQLNLSGKLFNPVVGFNIYLPVSDEETRTYVKNAISTEEELSRQFLYLLVMNSFYADPALVSSAPSTASSGTSAMAVTTTEMLSNQLSNWLSQISKDFDIGFVYRPGSGNKDINPQEVQVALSTQLLNNKVTINGNFDVRGTGNAPVSSNAVSGDFDAEYKITDKIRFKVFNRYNNPYSSGKGVSIPYTQGIGFFVKKDFDKISDLFRKKKKSDMKKEEVPVVK
jgi:hypothetical protein